MQGKSGGTSSLRVFSFFPENIMVNMDAIELGVFSSRLTAVCDEMGATLKRAALSPNIKDRLDYSCAVFDVDGSLCAQAAHIPVHLGSMAFAMRDIVEKVSWHDGDMLIVNNPYLGGTHLPDVTLISPVFVDDELSGFVANRAHHADIGAISPGSMPISQTLEEEGVIISPTLIVKQGVLDEDLLASITGATRNKFQCYGDYAAQMSANRCGEARLKDLVSSMSINQYRLGLIELDHYAERMALSGLAILPDGEYQFSDVMDDDGVGSVDIVIKANLKVIQGSIDVNFEGTSLQVAGNINCPLSVAAAAVFYVFRCLMPAETPACAGSFRSIEISAPEGSLLNARYPAAVAAGNVETSTRIVDVVMGALAQAIPTLVPAASQGSMNNIAMGGTSQGENWDYYETLGGGMGGGPLSDGLDAVQTHMTNTRNTPVETVEMVYPLRVTEYSIRQNSAGTGIHCGGKGLKREFEFLADSSVTLLTERRLHAPWGLNGGKPGLPGKNVYSGEIVPPKVSFSVKKGERLAIYTPGGGGWGSANIKPGKME